MAHGWGTDVTSKGNDTSKGSTWARQAISRRTACSSWARIRQAHTCTKMTATLLLHHTCKPKCSDDASKTPTQCPIDGRTAARSPEWTRPSDPGHWSDRSG